MVRADPGSGLLGGEAAAGRSPPELRRPGSALNSAAALSRFAGALLLLTHPMWPKLVGFPRASMRHSRTLVFTSMSTNGDVACQSMRRTATVG